MTLIHLANFNSTNVGNGALISGTERTLREDIHGIRLLSEAWDDYTFGIKKFDEKFVDMVNKTDGLLIGAAVTFNGQAYQKETGTRFELPLPLWHKITKPIIFYGISHRHWNTQQFHNLEQLKNTFRYINSAANVMVSMRNDGTKEWLEKILCFSVPKIQVIPDPALFLNTKPVIHSELMSDKKNIILSLNNEDETFRFGTPERKKGAFQHIADALAEVNKRYPINIILAPHYFDDFKAISEFIPLCPLRFPHQNIVSAGMARASRAEYFYDLYAHADLALSMRVHSMSPSIGLGTPMIALTSQERMTHFLKDADLEDCGIDIFNSRLSRMLSERIIDFLKKPMSVRKRFARATSQMRKRTHDFNLSVQAFIAN